MHEITSTRSNALVDPAVHVWHGEIPIYLFLGGLVAGIMVLTGARFLRGRDSSGSEPSRALSLVPWAAPALLTLGMLFLWLDLENRWNAFRFYFAFRPSSPMSWGAWILLAVYPVSIAMAWLSLSQATRDGLVRRYERALSWFDALVVRFTHGIALASVLAGAALGVYTGVLLGTMAARPLWNSAILGPLFLVSGLSSAAAFVLLQRVNDDERIALGRLDAAFMLAEGFLIVLWLVGLSTGSASARAAAGMLLGGPFTAAFWTLVIALGLVTPLWAEWMEMRHKVLPSRMGAALVLIGGLALRWIVVAAGQESAIVAQTALR